MEFEKWLAEEIANGLVDLRLTVVNADGISADAIKRELLECEAALKAGRVRQAPSAQD